MVDDPSSWAWTQIALSSDMSLIRSLTSFFLSIRLCLFSRGILFHCVPRSGSPSSIYAQAATNPERLGAVKANSNVLSAPLKQLIKFLALSLSPRLRHHELSNVHPSWNYISPDFLEAGRVSFMYRLARGSRPHKDQGVYSSHPAACLSIL